jgi:DHA1 family multidrug resistance protein-like MFS transporter/DHA1 family quinolone resistance protein-like MFS transporter
MRVTKLAIVCPSALVMGVTTNCLNFALVFYAHDKFGADTFQASLFGSLYSLSYLLCCSFGGKLLQKIPPLRSILLAISFVFIGLWLMLKAPTLTIAYIVQTGIGISISLFWPQLMGWLSSGQEGKQLARATSFFNFSWSTGTIVAPFLAGFLSDLNGVYPLYACLAFTAVNGLYVALAGYRLQHDETATAAATTTSSTAAQQQLGDHSPTIRFPAWYGLVCAWFAIGFLYNSYPLMAEQSLGFSRQHIGNLILLRALFATIMMTAMGFCSFWQFRYWQLIAGHLLLAVNMLLFGFASNSVSITMLISMSGILCAHAYTNSMFHGISGSTNRTLRMAIHEAALSIGAVIGGAATGWLFERTRSIRGCGLFVAAIVASAVVCDILFAIMAGRRRAH